MSSDTNKVMPIHECDTMTKLDSEELGELHAPATSAPLPSFEEKNAPSDSSTLSLMKAHKWKVSACILLSIAAIVLGLYFGLLKILAGHSTKSNAATVAAITGTTFKTVSVVPAKGSSSTSGRRRLLFSSVVNQPSSFDPLSDYALTPPPAYVVSDEAAQSVNTINMIGCLINQLR